MSSSLSSSSDTLTSSSTLSSIESSPPLPDHLPHELKGLWRYEYSSPNWWMLLAIALFCALVAYGLYAYWKKKRQVVPKTKIIEDPLLVAFRTLKNMSVPQPFEGKTQQLYFFELSLKFRELIELSSGIRATDLTSKELREPLREKLPLSRTITEDMIRFFDRSEMIKFAQSQTHSEEALYFLNKVIEWSEQLVPKNKRSGSDLSIENPKGKNPPPLDERSEGLIG